MSNQVHHAIWHRETYSAEGVLECLSGMPFDVEFISFDDVKKGIPKDIRVIINVEMHIRHSVELKIGLMKQL